MRNLSDCTCVEAARKWPQLHSVFTCVYVGLWFWRVSVGSPADDCAPHVEPSLWYRCFLPLLCRWEAVKNNHFYHLYPPDDTFFFTVSHSLRPATIIIINFRPAAAVADRGIVRINPTLLAISASSPLIFSWFHLFICADGVVDQRH